MKYLREGIHVFVRRFGFLYSSCCEAGCGEHVSPAQSHILFEIRRMGRPSMQQVAEELGIDSTTFSRQVKSLTEKGLTVRRVSQEDRRVNLLELTDEGVCMLERIDLQVNEKMVQVFSDMTDFERDCVCRSLELLSGVMEKTGSVGPKKSRHATENIRI